MKRTEMTCILCPMGCRLSVSQDGDRVVVTGNTCKRGEAYGEQELVNPMRVVTSSVWVDGGALPLCPVKTRGQVPKARIADVLAEISAARATAPVALGQVIVPDVAGTGVDVVATGTRE